MLLAIDTATRVASIALYGVDGVYAEITWRSRENHTVELMPQIVRVLALASVAKGDLQGIGVAMGPGSFTGLRVGMSVAKGMAYGGRIPLFGIPTLDVVAQAHVAQALPIWAVISAGRGRYSVARYATEGGAVRRVGDYALVNSAAFVDLACATSHSGQDLEPALFCGEVDGTLAKLLAESLGECAIIDKPASRVRRAGFLAELAWERLKRGDSDNVESLAPLYAPQHA